MQKAEAKIRAAFAGLAQERDQISKGVTPAGSGPKPPDKGRIEHGGEWKGVLQGLILSEEDRDHVKNSHSVSREATLLA